MSYLNLPVSQIATEIPGATAIFFQHKINFCCDGAKLLADVIKKKRLDAIQIVDALTRLNERKAARPELEKLDNLQLIDYILTRFHQVHREQLVELQRLAQRVEQVHGEHPLCPRGLTQHLAKMSYELDQHMKKEESILFPMLSRSLTLLPDGPISIMKAEHEDHLEDIQVIYELTQDVIPHPGACNTWQALYLGLQEFISDLNQHIHTENKILFERANQ